MDAIEQLDNVRLGHLHDELIGAKDHFGAELQEVQELVQRLRRQRRRLGKELARTMPASAVDAALDHMCEPHAAQRQALRRRARQLNYKLNALRVAIEVVDEEMTRRIRKRGFTPLPGHARYFRDDRPAVPRRRRKRTQSTRRRPAGSITDELPGRLKRRKVAT
ncbi:MAG TPA: hypothetical protein VJN18_30190 [Polyangiaceae bacterium]|nr:hypothetical protein [Polyangiaceae bacterium]